MQKSQIIVLLGAVLLLGGLWFFGRTTPNASQVAQGANMVKPATIFSFDDYLLNATSKLDSSSALAIKNLEGKKDTGSLHQISAIWGKAKQGIISAKYNADAAKLENTEKSLTFASQYYIDLYNLETDTIPRKWMAKQAAELLQTVLQKNATNEAAKVALAQCYTDGTGETMKGVLMLKDVAEKNPANLAAGITLGRLAIKSGQFEKAVERLEKLSLLHKNNSEVLYHLGEAYKCQGNVSKAKELFSKTKKIVNNPNYSKEIDEYIKTF